MSCASQTALCGAVACFNFTANLNLGPAYHAKAELHFALGAVAVASQFMPALSQAT